MDFSPEDEANLAQIEARYQKVKAMEKEFLDHFSKLYIASRRLQTEAGQISNKKAFISRLPDDVLAIVFERSLRWFVELDHLSTLFTLSHVSRRWRAVILNAPLLWSRAYIRTSQPVSLLDVYIARSKMCHLDLEIRVMFNTSIEQLQHFLTRVVSVMGRISHLTFEIPKGRQYTSIVTSLANTPAPVLKHLEIKTQSHEMFILFEPSILFANKAPMLTSLNIGCFASEGLQFLPPTITSLTSRGVTTNQNGRFAQMLHNLLKLTRLTIIPLRTAYGSIFGPIRLPSLKHLHISPLFDDISRIFEMIDTPSLESLELGSGNPDLFTQSLIRAWEDSSRIPENLQTVAFRSLLPSKAFLKTLPNITHATFDMTGIVRLLSVSDRNKQYFEHGIPWPHLHTITIDGLGYYGPNTKVNYMVASRMEAGYPLMNPLSEIMS